VGVSKPRYGRIASSGLQMVELTLLSSQDGLVQTRADVERPQQEEDS